MELKKLDVTQPTFVANGVTYYIESALSIERFCEYQILEKEAGFGLNFKKIFNELKELHNLMNNVKFVEAAVKLNNLMRGVAKLEDREPTLLKICALFINEKDENRSIINNDMIVKKIADWKVDYEVNGFFTLALNMVDGFLEIYAKATHIISGVKDSKNPKEGN